MIDSSSENDYIHLKELILQRLIMQHKVSWERIRGDDKKSKIYFIKLDNMNNDTCTTDILKSPHNDGLMKGNDYGKNKWNQYSILM